MRVASPCCLLAVFAIPSLAQEYRAAITGQVTDQSGAAISGAKVIATSVERNIPYESLTNSAGRYNIQFLLPGRYIVTVEKQGFKKFEREAVSLLASDKLALDVKLPLGPPADTVTVSSAAPLLQTESATRQAVIENRILENVPSG